MYIELVVPLAVNALSVFVLASLYPRFKPFSDVLIIVGTLDLAKIASLCFVLALFWELFVLFRPFVYPNITVKEQQQMLKDTFPKVGNMFFRLFQYVSPNDFLSSVTFKMLVFALVLANLNLYLALLQARNAKLHDLIVERQIAFANKSYLNRQIFQLFVNALRPVAFILAVLYVTVSHQELNLDNFNYSTEFLCQREMIFILIQLVLNLAKELVFLVFHVCIFALSSAATPVFVCLQQVLFFLLDLVKMGAHFVNLLNTVLMMEYDSNITQYKQIIEQIRQGKLQRKRQDRGLKLLFLSDLLDMMETFKSFRVSFKTLTLNYKSAAYLGDFDIPTYEQLYNQPEDVVRADPERYVQEALCPICMDGMDLVKNAEGIRILRCRHAYHTKCLRNWIVRGNAKCPVCNHEVFQGGAAPHDEAAQQQEPLENEQLIPEQVEEFGEPEKSEQSMTDEDEVQGLSERGGNEPENGKMGPGEPLQADYGDARTRSQRSDWQGNGQPEKDEAEEATNAARESGTDARNYRMYAEGNDGAELLSGNQESVGPSWDYGPEGVAGFGRQGREGSQSAIQQVRQLNGQLNNQSTEQSTDLYLEQLDNAVASGSEGDAFDVSGEMRFGVPAGQQAENDGNASLASADLQNGTQDGQQVDALRQGFIPDKGLFDYSALEFPPAKASRKPLFSIPVYSQSDNPTFEELVLAAEQSTAQFIERLRLKKYLEENPDVYLRLLQLKNSK